MATLLITGATGLAGSNACRTAVARGHTVRALAREGSDAEFAVDLGAEVVRGDVTSAEDIVRASRGVDGIIHTAALLGTPAADYTYEQYRAVNERGTVHVLDAAAAVGARAVVCTTNVIFKQTGSTPLHEESALLPTSDRSIPYYNTKHAAYVEAMRRAEAGADVLVVVPGAIYGPAPSGRRALDPTSFNGMLLEAYRGELTRFPTIPFSWALGADVGEVSIRAFESGQAGHRYLATGHPADRLTMGEFCNTGLALLGSPRRVEDVDVTDQNQAVLHEKFHGMEMMGRWRWPDPLVDPARTTAALGFEPTRAADGIAATVAWLRTIPGALDGA